MSSGSTSLCAHLGCNNPRFIKTCRRSKERQRLTEETATEYPLLTILLCIKLTAANLKCREAQGSKGKQQYMEDRLREVNYIGSFEYLLFSHSSLSCLILWQTAGTKKANKKEEEREEEEMRQGLRGVKLIESW